MKGLLVLCAVYVACSHSLERANEQWWQTMSLYQIYPRSFKDSDGDGIGDLKGITDKLDHLTKSNIDAFWLSPIYPSPMVDFGYDISDFIGIDPVYGTMQDFDELVKVAHNEGLKVIMDFVPNHSSDKHEWFQKSLKMIEPYTDYYVWHEGKVLANGTVTRPNNWVSVFGGPAWTWREERQAYYFHQFAPEQPDLNYNNEHVIRDMKGVMRFWLDKGVDGFRIDAVPHLMEDERFLDEPLSGHTDDPNNYGYTEKVYTKDQQGTYDTVRGWREVLDEYTAKDGIPRVMMIEAYTNMPLTMKYYEYGAHFPFNFGFVSNVGKYSKASDFKSLIDEWMSNSPNGATSNWVAGNHDKPRLVTRFGSRAPAVTLMTLLLPGVGVTYFGEEIGMEDTWISWEETKDPQGCNAGKNGYEMSSRDPARTPFQWDDTTSAGFSTNPKTWLPVNQNYKKVNLAAQKNKNNSYYEFYKDISFLRKQVQKDAPLTTKLLNDNVFGFSRHNDDGTSIYVVMNFAENEEIVDLSSFEKITDNTNLHCTTISPDLENKANIATVGTFTDNIANVRIPGSGSVLCTSTVTAS